MARLLKKNVWRRKTFEQQFLSLFSPANFIFDIYFSTHTKEKDWQGFPFQFLIEFSEVQREGTLLETIKSMISAWNRTLACENTSFQTLHVVDHFFCCVLMWWLMYCLNSTIICCLTCRFVCIPWSKTCRVNKCSVGWLAPKPSFSYLKIRPMFQLFSNNFISCIINIQR